MRHVSQNRPFVIRRGASKWPACRKWNADYLRSVMGDAPVNVAITPHGNADSVLSLKSPDGKELLLFVKPYETQEPFSAALSSIQSQSQCQHPSHPSSSSSSSSPSPSAPPVRYLQTQNDNLRAEFLPLFADVPPSIPFARIALGQDPDAINFWLGNASSVTALHKDNYENVYVQVLGQKHFVLLPPVESACVNEQAVLSATYKPRSGSGLRRGDSGPASTSTPTPNPDSDSASLEVGARNGKEEVQAEGEYRLSASDLIPHIDTPRTYTPFATWDPDSSSSPYPSSSPNTSPSPSSFPSPNMSSHPTKFSNLSRPLRVTLNPSDMLYLPALWYHKVSQSCSDEGICCAVNYWYDVDFGGGFWSMAGFVRGVAGLSLRGQDGVEYKSREDQGEEEEQDGKRDEEEQGQEQEDAAPPAPPHSIQEYKN
ncbi:Clavaminate synthase-like protein [Lophiostoma macrostomum CBS 122681]|uniref:Clavaminate synthase-like protein n=1 Tax=Lophiostoma macrostomum CBS 122681 TaxID=1314788 RepID=A0A6A6SLU7_9PLEO|nr:Clavaminate synthase-like protein [Lophiostoma macrostomum CBS 122681]